MALPSTLHHLDVALEHVDRGIHERLAAKVVRHPSETVERLWLRVLAYLWLYEERLGFGPGLCEPDEPDLVARDLTGEVTLWVRVGRPDPARVQREADRNGRARVAAVFESPAALDRFVEEAGAAGLSRLARVELAAFDPRLVAALAERAERRARLGVTIVGDHVYADLGGEAFDGAIVRRSIG